MPINLNILEPARNQSEKVIYRDLSLNMSTGIVKGNDAESPANLKDLNTSTDFEAVRNSLINLIKTFPGQKILNPEFGMNFGDLLFLPVSKARGTTIGETITNSIVGFEPRININLVEVIADIEKHEYEINLEITIPEFENKPLNISGRLNKSGFYTY
tara:strand:- start:97 stop:570 length:474 start_codon:yes stop_codon:yes gene_type:complete